MLCAGIIFKNDITDKQKDPDFIVKLKKYKIYLNNIFLRYAEQMVIGDEVLVKGSTGLTSGHVTKISELKLQGNIHSFYSFYSFSLNLVEFFLN